MGLRRLYTLFTHFAEVICRRNHQKPPKIVKNTKRHHKSPAIPTNQSTCTTNMIPSHLMHWLWGLQRRTEVYISPKNEYFCITPKNGSAQECGSKGGPHGNISARKINISARFEKKQFYCTVKFEICQYVDF